jgi:alpha-glucoside transport system substrate-binding protein
MRQYAAQGALAPLDDVLDTARLQEEYPEGFMELSKVNDQIYGAFVKAAVKGLVWYRPDVFQERGYQVPQTWEELQSLEQQIISEGATPWCVGVESLWPGTDWVEDLMLRTAGPETYDAWWEHSIPWTDPAVAGAWEAWGRFVGDPAMVYGGPTFVLSNNAGDASATMFGEEPGCFLHRQASFFTTFVAEQFPTVQLGEDLNFFPFPAIDEQHGSPLLVSGDMVGMFNDTPQARALMEYLTSAEAQTIWAEKGGFIAPNRAVSPDVYPDDITRAVAQAYVEAESVRFDASDLMPQPVQEAFHSGIVQFVQDPGSLQSVLEDIESAAQEADQQ